MIQIDFADARPIYKQLIEEIKMLMVTNEVKNGDRLPSVRDLANQLEVNPNTIQRAYRELEHAGFIQTVPGKGSFASGRKEVVKARKKELVKELEKVIEHLWICEVSDEEIMEIVNKMSERKHK